MGVAEWCGLGDCWGEILYSSFPKWGLRVLPIKCSKVDVRVCEFQCNLGAAELSTTLPALVVSSSSSSSL